jgi:hypothetical protein
MSFPGYSLAKPVFPGVSIHVCRNLYFGELSEEETARLRGIGDALNLSPDDAVWDILAAMEYRRVFYEELPEKIAQAALPTVLWSRRKSFP